MDESTKRIEPSRYKHRSRTPVEVVTILRAVLGAYGLDRELNKHEFFQKWSDIVGPQISAKTVPEKIQGTCLLVRVESSAWAQELGFQKGVILARIARVLGGDAVRKGINIKDIRFVVGKASSKNKIVAARPPLPRVGNE